MSAEILRRAAALMRERAEAATPGPWQHFGDHLVWPSERGPAANDPIAGLSGEHEESAEHIASWHPAVALKIAAFLDFAAAYGDQPSPQSPTVQFAASVARAYLGEPS